MSGIDLRPLDVLKLGFWNINGLNSKVIGNKLTNQDFSLKMESCNIIGLAETHSHSLTLEKLSIPGFARKHYAIRDSHYKGCGSGGIALFCRHDISKYITVVLNCNKDVIWVKIAKELCGEDVYLGTIYLSPIGKKDYIVKKFQSLSDEITQFQCKGKIILQGDFNARTSNKEDIIRPDKHDQDEELDGKLTLLLRNSKDIPTSDIRCEELLELCKAHKLVILNGRKTGDPWGKITSYQWNGRAVVDYVLMSCELFDSITYFKVGDYSPWISDHCPLLFEMHSKTALSEVIEELDELPKTFYIGPRNKTKYLETLKSSEIAVKLLSLNTLDNPEPQELTTKITEILIDSCDKAGIKPNKQKIRAKIQEPWFDEECKNLKNSIKTKCRKLRKNNKNDELHISILKENKFLKNLIRKKEEAYKRGIIKEMNLKKRDQKFYWKLLGKLQSQKNDVFKQLIPGEKWNNHFKDILINKRRTSEMPPDSVEPGILDYPITENELNKASYIIRPGLLYFIVLSSFLLLYQLLYFIVLSSFVLLY